MLFLICPILSAKTYDCFMFNHELDLLEIRLNEMYEYVDHFVLVECTETHRGGSKELIYEKNKGRFSKFNDKIIHVIVEDRLNTTDLWAKENYQRDQIIRGLKNCSDKDIIIISDLDEIIRGKDLKSIISHLANHRYVACQLDLFVYYLNGLCGQWNGPVVTTYKPVRKKGANYVRSKRNSVFAIQNVGWHFSSVGGIKANITKIDCNVHGAEIPPTTEANIAASMEATPCIPLDPTFPQYVIDRHNTYIQKGMIKEECKTSRSIIGKNIHL